MTQTYFAVMNILWSVTYWPFFIVMLHFLKLECHMPNCMITIQQSNSKFALSIEPKNEALKSYATHVANLRSKGLPTVIFWLFFYGWIFDIKSVTILISLHKFYTNIYTNWKNLCKYWWLLFHLRTISYLRIFYPLHLNGRWKKMSLLCCIVESYRTSNIIRVLCSLIQHGLCVS